jgi:hypothetical protein
MIWLSQEMIETLNVRNCTSQRERFYLKSTIMSLIMTKAITLLLLSVALSLTYAMLYILEDICNLLEQ